MAKIDTTQIEGYETMSVEDKLKALESFEYEDNLAELRKQKDAVSKANSEAASWKRKHNELLSEDERKKQEQADSLAAMQQELDELRKEKTISDYTSKFVAQGYDESLAAATAKALADGDSATVFANQSKFLDDYAKKVKADALKKTPRPDHLDGGNGEIDYDKKIEDARVRGDMSGMAYYTRLKAESEARAKS